MTTLNGNIFRQAEELLDNSNGRQLTDQEWEVLGAAMIPLNHPVCPFPDDMPIGDCLEELAKMLDGGKDHE